VKLPRAIGFTGALYSLGIPPEFIGTGRGIRYAMRVGKIRLLEKYYVNLKNDLLRAGGFLNKDGLKKLAEKFPAWNGVLEDVYEIEQYLGKKLGPKTKEEKEHSAIVDTIHERLEAKQSIERYLPALAKLRKSVG